MSERLVLDRVVRTYQQGQNRLEVLRGASLAIRAGEIVALIGPSGAGKSTLLHVAGLLDRADGGEVVVAGRPASAMGEAERTRSRRELIGFIYQFHYLLADFSALENVVLPQLVAGKSRVAATARATALLEGLGLGARLAHRPARLSGGEQQRVAIARALANEPKILLADEPTGNLDLRTAETVFNELVGLAREHGLAALIATHNNDLAVRLDRTVRLEDGLLVPA